MKPSTHGDFEEILAVPLFLRDKFEPMKRTLQKKSLPPWPYTDDNQFAFVILGRHRGSKFCIRGGGRDVSALCENYGRKSQSPTRR